ncbi:MAG: HlyD family efflux transporter periplasmic adaptor subunit, partial [Myxococcota bacterium]
VQQDQSRLAVTEQRRFAEGADATAIDRARIGASLSEDRAELDGLNERLRVEESLLASGASSAQAVDEWRRQIRVVEARLAANRSALALASTAASGARERQQAVPVANEWAVVAATRELEVIEGRIARHDLPAGVAGEVSWVYRSVGEVVPAGEPVLQVRPVATREVVAFVAPSDAVDLVPGEAATVRRASGQVVRGALKSVGAGPQPLPEALWALPSWPQYGVPVRVELEGDIGPDEVVTVRL